MSKKAAESYGFSAALPSGNATRYGEMPTGRADGALCLSAPTTPGTRSQIRVLSRGVCPTQAEGLRSIPDVDPRAVVPFLRAHRSSVPGALWAAAARPEERRAAVPAAAAHRYWRAASGPGRGRQRQG